MIAFLLLATLSAQDTLRFDFTVQTVRSIRPTSDGRAVAEDSLSVGGRLTVVLTDTVGGRVAHVRIDSAGPAQRRDRRPPQLTGTRYHLLLHPDGTQGAIETEGRSLDELQGLSVVAAMFPTVRSGIGIDGRWVDTTEVEHVVGGVRASGNRITQWHVLDRRDDRTLASGSFRGSSTAALDPSNTIAMTQLGTIRALVRAGWPAEVSQVVDTATVRMTLGGTTLTIAQHTVITVVRRGFRPIGAPNPRRRVPG